MTQDPEDAGDERPDEEASPPSDAPDEQRSKDVDPQAGASRQAQVRVADRKTLARRRLVVWLIFGVVFALLPLIVDGMREFEGSGFRLQDLLASGEQFVIGAVIAVGASGEVIAATVPEEEKTAVVVAGGSSLLLFVADLLAYSGVRSASSGAVLALTLILVPLTVLVSAFCIRMAAGR